MNFTGPATRLTSTDIGDVAKFLGTNRAAVLAVMEVEAAGAGFDARARPRILFEPHVFYRELRGTKRSRAINEGLAYKRWGTRRYPRTSDARYRQLRRAMKIDRDAALRSASWGLGQVMGFNHELAGFDDVEEFVQAMTQGEREQLLAMASFIKKKNLHLPMRRRQWAKFARGYNGKGYRKNEYDVKLARAYKRHLNAGDFTPRVPSALREGDRGGRVRAWQESLAKLGYTVAVDGAFGPKTEAATRLFQRRFDLEADGIVGPVTRNAMAEALKGQKPATAAPTEVVPVTPTETKASFWDGLVAFLAELFIQTSREVEV